MSRLGRCEKCSEVLVKATGQDGKGKSLEVHVCPKCIGGNRAEEQITKKLDRFGLEELKK